MSERCCGPEMRQRLLSLSITAFIAVIVMNGIKVWGQRRKQVIGGACAVLLAAGAISPVWLQQAALEHSVEYAVHTVKNVPDALLDGSMLWLITAFFNWVNKELQKDDPVVQFFQGRLNTSLNLVLGSHEDDLGLRTLSEDAVGDYFPSEEAQKSIFEQAEQMTRDDAFYPYISLPAGEKKAFCDHVINKVSSMFAVQHILADGCTRGDYEDVEYCFGLSFEVPESGNVDMIQQKFRIYVVKTSCLEKTARNECRSPIPYFLGRWNNLRVLHRISGMSNGQLAAMRNPSTKDLSWQDMANAIPKALADEASFHVPVCGRLRLPLPPSAVRHPSLGTWQHPQQEGVFGALPHDEYDAAARQSPGARRTPSSNRKSTPRRRK